MQVCRCVGVLSVCQYVCWSVCLSVSQSVSLCVCLSVCLPVYLEIVSVKMESGWWFLASLGVKACGSMFRVLGLRL